MRYSAWIPHRSTSFESMCDSTTIQSRLSESADFNSISLDSYEGVMMEFDNPRSGTFQNRKALSIGIVMPDAFGYTTPSKTDREPISVYLMEDGEPTSECMDVYVENTGLIMMDCWDGQHGSAESKWLRSEFHRLMFYTLVDDIDTVSTTEDRRHLCFEPTEYFDRTVALTDMLDRHLRTIQNMMMCQDLFYGTIAETWRGIEFRSEGGLVLVHRGYIALKDLLVYGRSFVSVFMADRIDCEGMASRSFDLYESSIDCAYQTHMDHYSNHLSSAVRALTVVTVLATALGLASVLMDRRAPGGSVGYNYYRARD